MSSGWNVYGLCLIFYVSLFHSIGFTRAAAHFHEWIIPLIYIKNIVIFGKVYALEVVKTADLDSLSDVKHIELVEINTLKRNNKHNKK